MKGSNHLHIHICTSLPVLFYFFTLKFTNVLFVKDELPEIVRKNIVCIDIYELELSL